MNSNLYTHSSLIQLLLIWLAGLVLYLFSAIMPTSLPSGYFVTTTTPNNNISKFFQCLRSTTNLPSLDYPIHTTLGLTPTSLIIEDKATRQPCQDPLLGPAGWWPAEGDTTDLSGHNPPGILQGETSFAPGKTGQAFVFDGDGDWVDLGNQTGDFGTGDFTLALWVYFDTLAGEQVLMEDYVEGDGPFIGWSLSKHSDNRLFFGWNGGQQVNIPSGLVKALQWHHVAVTRTGTTFTIYLDGVVRDVQIWDTTLASTAHLKLGMRGAPAEIPGHLYLDGMLDEVQVYDCTLSNNEIQKIFNFGGVGICNSKVQFSSSNYNIHESGGEATITATLRFASPLTITADYASSNGAALADSDYLAKFGTLTFLPCVTSQTFTVTIINDSMTEVNESLSLTLSNPTNASLQSPYLTTLTIFDDDTSPIRQLFFPIISFVRAAFPVTIGAPIPQRPANYQSEIFYTQAVYIPISLPTGGRFYLSANPNKLTKVLVDDNLVH